MNENHPKGWVLFKKDKTVKHKMIINDGEYIIENEYGTKILSRELEKMLLEEIEIIENIGINIKNTYGEASFMMDFSEFDKIVKYVNNLRKLLDK